MATISKAGELSQGFSAKNPNTYAQKTRTPYGKELELAVRELVNNDISACSRACVLLYKNHCTKESNISQGIQTKESLGFTHIDRGGMTRMATTALRNGSISTLDFEFLTAPIDRCGTRIGKYHSQLHSLVTGHGAQSPPPTSEDIEKYLSGK